METQPGPYVEPVQLQVVCFRLWDKLPETKNAIVEGDIADVGDVNTALADYYDTSVKNIAAASGESEREIREWFDRQLITEQGIRGQVLMDARQVAVCRIKRFGCWRMRTSCARMNGAAQHGSSSRMTA